MGFISILFSLITILFVANVESQSILSGIQGSQRGLQGVDRLPVIGACDRIASRGVTNCMQNFLPTSLLSGLSSGQSGGGICCNYSKYKACISGLHDGLRIAMKAKRCPKSYSTRIIKSFGDSFVGLPIKNLCQSNEGTQCPKTGGNRKKPNKPSRRTTPKDESPSFLEPVRGIAGGFGRNPSDESTSIFEPVLQPVRGIFGGSKKSSRRTDSSDESSSFLEPVRGIFGGSGKNSGDESSSIFEPILQPVRGIFGGSKKATRRSSSSDESPSVLEQLSQPVRDIFGGI